MATPKGWRLPRGKMPRGVAGSRSKGIPEAVQTRTKDRILAYAEEHFAGKYDRIEVHFRGTFCYIDAYQEPAPAPGGLLAATGETPQGYLERLRQTPIHLCRLRYLGSTDHWGWALYTYSHERYEESVFFNGAWSGAPEEAFMLAANLYLH
jgi:hypothetical protein